MEPHYDPVIALIGIYPKVLISAYYRDAVTPMSTVAQFKIAKLGKLHWSPSTDEWLKKMQCDTYIYIYGHLTHLHTYWYAYIHTQWSIHQS